MPHTAHRLGEQIRSAIAWVSPATGTPIEAWRRRILGAVLLGMVVFGALAYVPSVYIAWRMGVYSVIVVDTVAYLALVALLPARWLGYGVRAFCVVAFPCVLGLFFLAGWGFEAAGFLWLLSFPILASVLLGLRDGVRALLFTLLALVVLGVLIARGVFPWANAMDSPLAMWIVSSVSLMMLATLTTVSVGVLFDGLGNEAAARQAAERESERLAGAVEQSGDVVLLLDVSGRVTYANRAAATLIAPSFDLTALPQWPAVRAGDAWAGDVEARGSDGATMVNLSGTISPVRDSDGAVTYVLATLRDVRRERALELRLQQGQKLEAIGTLAGGIAHDFNNLLQPILLNTETVQSLLTADHSAQPLLHDVRQSAERARSLVRRILTFTRAIEHERHAIDLGALLEETERLLRTALPTSISLVTNVARDVVVEAESGELQQVLLNLSTNAAHAMPAGGTLRLDVRVVPCADVAELRAAFPAHATVACLSVTDNGNGMDEATLARAFEPFFTTKGPGRGTGLGLAMVHGTVTALGGCVLPESRLGLGTSMRVYLPLVQMVARHDTPAAVRQAAPDRRQVLVVDDELAVLNATTRLLQRLGWEVQPFNDAGGALEYMRNEARGIDIVLTDLSMPGMSGVQLADELHRRYPALPIVLTTGFLEHEGLEGLTLHGVGHVLAKPYSSVELQRVLDALLATNITS